MAAGRWELQQLVPNRYWVTQYNLQLQSPFPKRKKKRKKTTAPVALSFVHTKLPQGSADEEQSLASLV
jgi:hypothetical protein